MSGPVAPGRTGLVAGIVSGLTIRARRGGPREAAEAEPAAGHGPVREHEDVDVANTALVMGGLALAAVSAVGLMVWLLGTVAGEQRAALPALTPQQTARLTPPAPNLQANPYADLDRARTAERARLDGYAYTDEARTRARIPIARARELVLGRSLGPAPAAGPEAAR